MTSLPEYCLLALVCLCLWREWTRLAHPPYAWQIDYWDFMRNHAAWTQHVREAREEGLAGPPRLERRDGQLCIVGLGRCEPVDSVFEGVRRIEDIQNQVAALFPTTKALTNVPR